MPKYFSSDLDIIDLINDYAYKEDTKQTKSGELFQVKPQLQLQPNHKDQDILVELIIS